MNPSATTNSVTPRKIGNNVLSWATDIDDKTLAA